MVQRSRQKLRELEQRAANGDEQASEELQVNKESRAVYRRRYNAKLKEKRDAGDETAILVYEKRKKADHERYRKRRYGEKATGSRPGTTNSAADDDDYVPSEDGMSVDRDHEEMGPVVSSCNVQANVVTDKVVRGADTTQFTGLDAETDATISANSEVTVVADPRKRATPEAIDLCGDDNDANEAIKSEVSVTVKERDRSSEIDIKRKLEELARKKARNALEAQQVKVSIEQMDIEDQERDLELRLARAQKMR